MTIQVKDHFVWDGNSFDFFGAEDIYSLFDPEEYGLYPEMMSTACYKGFIITFEVRNKKLFIDELIINCKDDVYPVINGVEATFDEVWGAQAYRNLNIASSYTGTITISIELREEVANMRGAFTDGPSFYSKTYELDFEDGELTEYRDISNEFMNGFFS